MQASCLPSLLLRSCKLPCSMHMDPELGGCP